MKMSQIVSGGRMLGRTCGMIQLIEIE